MLQKLLTIAAIAALAACSPPSTTSTSSETASAPPLPAPVSAQPLPAPPGAAGASMDAAKTLSVGMADTGAFDAQSKSGFYRFDNKLKVRDLALVRLENQSTTLKPDFKIYDFNKSQIAEKYDGTPGANAETTISVTPGQSFFVEVLPYASVGKYKLSVTMQNAADQFEPNDDILNAAAVNVGKDVAGSVMDEKDNDFFRFSGATKPAIAITLENQSTTLKPDVKIYDANKSLLTEKYDGTAGANLSFPITVEPGKDFYVEIIPNGSSGKYKLSAK